MAQTESGATTRTRIIEAASELFASHGFECVSVRQICQRAGANIAAVNYHFRDKESLYKEVLLSAYRAARERYPVTAGVTPNDPPEARLRAFVMGMLHRIFDEGSPAWGRLLAREMVEPTAALDGLIAEGMRPQYELLSDIVRGLLGRGADETTVRRCASSVVSQVLVHQTCRNVMQRMHGDRRDGRDQIEELADHIVRFSLAGLKSCAPAGVVGAAR